MIYMVEMDFRHPEREAEWHAWYLAHIRVLLTVPGFRASQRFQSIVPGTPSPYLALHEVASAAMFNSAAYRSRGGPPRPANGRHCSPIGTATCWKVSTRPPRCRADAYVLLLRDAPDAGLPKPVEMHRLRGVGLDRTIAECSLAVVHDLAPFEPLARRDQRVRLYRPISEKIRGAAG